MDQAASRTATVVSGAAYQSFADATRSVLDLLEQQLPQTAIFLAHLDRQHDLLRIVDARGGGAFGLRSNLAIPLSDSFDVHMADGRAPRRCDDVIGPPVYGRVAAQARFGAGSYLGATLELSDGTRVGTLSALSREPGRFREYHERLLEMLARVLAVELERETDKRDLRRLGETMRGQARGMAAVGRAARALTGDGDPRRAVLRAVCEAADAPVAFLLEPSGRELVSTAAHGIEMAPVTVHAVQGGPRGAAGALGEYQQGYFVADARADPTVALALVAATDARSALFEPVLREGRVVGVIIVVWREPVQAPSDSVTAVLRLVAAQAAAAIEQAGLRQRLGALALSDPLTGLATRRMLDTELPRELARARRSLAPLCLAVVDLDGLASFNMLRGEQEGDRLLKETGAVWAATLRDVDYIARLEAGTYAVVLPGCALEEACEVLDRVRARTPREQTASAGVAAWDGGEPVEALEQRCRAALATAKVAGGDATTAA